MGFTNFNGLNSILELAFGFNIISIIGTNYLDILTSSIIPEWSIQDKLFKRFYKISYLGALLDDIQRKNEIGNLKSIEINAINQKIVEEKNHLSQYITIAEIKEKNIISESQKKFTLLAVFSSCYAFFLLYLFNFFNLEIQYYFLSYFNILSILVFLVITNIQISYGFEQYFFKPSIKIDKILIIKLMFLCSIIVPILMYFDIYIFVIEDKFLLFSLYAQSILTIILVFSQFAYYFFYFNFYYTLFNSQFVSKTEYEQIDKKIIDLQNSISKFYSI